MKTVGIIGGSGFIGSHTTKKFLGEGYKVRVSTTDISKTEKFNHLKSLRNAENLEIFPMNVKNKGQLKNFVNDCNIVIHGGTPYQLDVKDPKKELLDPTVEGTKNFLEVINETSNVEKVLFLASIASYNTNFPMPPDGMNFNDTIDENSIPFFSKESNLYGQAKFIANQTVEKFISEHPNCDFEITSVSPVAVFGKSLSNREDSVSSGLQHLIKNKIAPDPGFQAIYDNDFEFSMVDVSDVANAIYRAGIKKGLHGKNYILCSESWKVSDIISMLNDNKPNGNARVVYKSDASKKDLGIEYKPAIIFLSEFSK